MHLRGMAADGQQNGFDTILGVQIIVTAALRATIPVGEFTFTTRRIPASSIAVSMTASAWTRRFGWDSLVNGSHHNKVDNNECTGGGDGFHRQ